MLGTGSDGVLAYSAGLDLVGRNISNAGAAGYARRRALLEAGRVSGGAAGGVTFAGSVRAVDRFAAARVIAESSHHGAARARSDALAGLEGMVAPLSGGIADQLGALFDAATALSADADDPTARMAFVARAEGLAAGFRGAGDALASRRADLVQQASDVASEVSSRLSEVAELNARIAEAQGLGQDAGGLQDRRDIVVREIGDRMPIQAVEEFGEGNVKGAAQRQEPVDADLTGSGFPTTDRGTGHAELAGEVGLGPASAHAFSRDVAREERRQRLGHE